ncbi:hypothetical protein ACSBR2_029670 [Camellia fascicularis]
MDNDVCVEDSVNSDNLNWSSFDLIRGAIDLTIVNLGNSKVNTNWVLLKMRKFKWDLKELEKLEVRVRIWGNRCLILAKLDQFRCNLGL